MGITDDTNHYKQYTGLQVAVADGIATITLSNPSKKNAVSPQMSHELTLIWDDLGQDPDVKVIILTGDGQEFCSGVDLTGLARSDRSQGGPVAPMTRTARKHVMAILDCEKPTLAKVRGVAYGMGVNMALSCDMVFAAEGARFCDSHVKAGMVAGDGGVLLWPLAVGIHRAKEYLMTGEPVSARVAEEIGLINHCLADDVLDAHVQAMAEKLCRLPPHAVNYTKVALNVALKQMTASAFETSLAYELYTMQMADHKEALSAFGERRQGTYTGR